MHYINKHRPESIVTWDWKEQPRWAQIEAAVRHVEKFDLKPSFIEFETGSDQHAVMIAPEGFTEELAKMQHDKAEIFFE